MTEQEKIEQFSCVLADVADYINELWEVKEDYKHRAEVAEMALYNACKHFCQFVVPCPDNDCKRIFCDKQKYGCYHEYFYSKRKKTRGGKSVGFV